MEINLALHLRHDFYTVVVYSTAKRKSVSLPSSRDCTCYVKLVTDVAAQSWNTPAIYLPVSTYAGKCSRNERE
jgi:hypothetical protein